jgi:hypothetical protein
MEELSDGLNFGVIQRIGRGVGIYTKSVDGTLVTSVKSSEQSRL